MLASPTYKPFKQWLEAPNWKGRQIFYDSYVIYIKKKKKKKENLIFFLLFFFLELFFSLSPRFFLTPLLLLPQRTVSLFLFQFFSFFSSQSSFQLFCKSSMSCPKWKYIIVGCASNRVQFLSFLFFFSIFYIMNL